MQVNCLEEFLARSKTWITVSHLLYLRNHTLKPRWHIGVMLVPRTLFGKGVRGHVYRLQAGAAAGLSVLVGGQEGTRRIPLLAALRGRGLALPFLPMP